MAYDDDLADRVRALVGGEVGLSEKRMFGGLAFLLDGHLTVSASGRGGLLVRVDPAETDQLVTQEHVEPFEMRGRAMDGWLHVGTAAVDDDASLQAWVERSVAFVRALPPKR